MNILWLKTGPLHPLDTGGKIRTFNMLRSLKRDHHITYVALCAPDIREEFRRCATEYSQRQLWIPWRETRKYSLRFGLELIRNALLSELPYVIEKYRSTEMAAALQELDAAGEHDLIVCDFLTPAVNLLQNRDRLKTPSLLFQHNVESLIWKRLGENASDPVRRACFLHECRRMRKFESESCARFDGVVGVSEADCEILRRDFGATNVLGAVPTGVDCSFFCPTQSQRASQSLVFLGSMDWMPNIDAVAYFVEEIFPLVRQKFPNATCTIVGRNPPTKVKQLAVRRTDLRVTGTVEDVRPYLSGAAAMVVPLRVGSGTRIKIFEGMATGIPVISTPVGAEGLPVRHGENILLADTPADFAGQIAAVFAEPGLAQRIGAQGRQLVKEHFSWEAVARAFASCCAEVQGKRKGGQ